jgi:hypothetical protein
MSRLLLDEDAFASNDQCLKNCSAFHRELGCSNPCISVSSTQYCVVKIFLPSLSTLTTYSSSTPLFGLPFNTADWALIFLGRGEAWRAFCCHWIPNQNYGKVLPFLEALFVFSMGRVAFACLTAAAPLSDVKSTLFQVMSKTKIL